ncbi:TetR/AcrR family transcriptional regulator [Gordonia liuliyuniae]|uniref:TetR/AcrR family transcriptional regulator n=1 Tax=Gordonia liuliyuniae TaxID=2911517 RepID=A0ABS9IWK5_9ACTN|nr:TetR/AcrR family transcriptional regulator [Gordonia liuliyuniae]MCF8589855.1 TetR/AcrR family transcriptional regulator [Gordonia liuliyuniae]
MAEFSLPVHLRPPALGPKDLSSRAAQILDEMGNVFITEGFKHLTIADLASRLQCSRRTLYEIAPNRTELVLIAIDRRLRRVGRVGAERLHSITDPRELLEQYMLAGQSEVYRTDVRFTEDAARDPAVTRLMTDHFRYHVAIVQAIIEYGIDQGAFRKVNTRVVAEVIDASLARFADPDFGHATAGMTFEDATTELVPLLLAGIDVASRFTPVASTR